VSTEPTDNNAREANARNARFWADHFAEIEAANRAALGPHHQPGHTVAELITALVGQLDQIKHQRDSLQPDVNTVRSMIADHVGEPMPSDVTTRQAVQSVLDEIADLKEQRAEIDAEADAVHADPDPCDNASAFGSPA